MPILLFLLYLNICHVPQKYAMLYMMLYMKSFTLNSIQNSLFLPARASEQGNVIGLVSVYIYIFVIERTRDLIYLKFVATDFFQKIISPSAGENSGDLA